MLKHKKQWMNSFAYFYDCERLGKFLGTGVWSETKYKVYWHRNQMLKKLRRQIGQNILSPTDAGESINNSENIGSEQWPPCSFPSK